jgi:hypothetical protein
MKPAKVVSALAQAANSLKSIEPEPSASADLEQIDRRALDAGRRHRNQLAQQNRRVAQNSDHHST